MMKRTKGEGIVKIQQKSKPDDFRCEYEHDERFWLIGFLQILKGLEAEGHGTTRAVLGLAGASIKGTCQKISYARW